jgi:polysaccharide chain length determinant protein (PEP-CTERM system associated)
MTDLMQQFLEQVRALWPLRWKALIAAWILCCLGWLVLLVLPDQYKASARVYVNTKTALSPVLEGISVESDVRSAIDQVREALLSRPNLALVAKGAKLDTEVHNPADLDALLSSLRKAITISSSSTDDTAASAGESLYAISYSDSDRGKALLVVKSLVDGFVNGTIGNKRIGSEQAQSFLRQQIKDYEVRLAASEARLAEFKRNNLGLVPGDDKSDYFSRLNAEMAGLQQAETKLAIASGRRAELARQLEKTRPYLAGSSSSTTQAAGSQTDLSVRVQDSEAKLQELLLRFTDKHPEVIALRAQIEELKRQEVKELAEIAKGGAGSGAIRSLATNPVYQEIQMQMNQADVESASLRGEIAQHNGEIAKLKKVVNTAPEVEQKYAQLNRDYNVTKDQYTALAARLEKAKVTDNADDTGIVKFEVIDPPAADIRPTSPNRALLSIPVLLGGILGGIGLAWLLAKMRPTITGTRMLSGMTDVPIIGSISRIVDAQGKGSEAADLRKLVLTSASLLAVCVVFIAVQGPLLNLLHSVTG